MTDSPSTSSSDPSSRASPDSLDRLLHDTFGHDRFRPFQEEVCRAVVAGENVLLVMPTGAGKSLCYQLPGVARGGTTLVVSPLIALMEDQVAKLQALGLAAERIHSGRDRLESRAVCRDYLDGRLDYLFIAPERLSVPGFPEMLAKRAPVLVAVDEAHCISHWGHDFRPDYRLLGGRLPLLGEAPVIAMTATATPRVQEDIVRQLGLDEVSRFIHGFRRDNIAVEVVDMPPSARHDAVARVLADGERRPAIVYAPSRKKAEDLGRELGRSMRAAAYHAGMMAVERDDVQTEFLAGDLEVIVATIAFGMGVDKPDVRTVIHTGLPGSLESHYQEIGRAGRDGAPSRAILLYSWADRRTHEFFHDRDYPDPDLLERIARALPAEPQPVEAVRAHLELDEELFGKALEKLVVHGGARLDRDDLVARGGDGWRKPYVAQRNHKAGQLDDVFQFAQAKACRMLHLVEHFGDQKDSGRLCGTCDVCDPDACLVRRFRAPTPEEIRVATDVLATLREVGSSRGPVDGLGTGRLFRETGGSLQRREFEKVLAGLARLGLVEVGEDSFEKDGELIRYQKASLSAAAWSEGPEALEDLQVAETLHSKKSKRKRSGGSSSRRGRVPEASGGLEADAPPELVERLKAWRLERSRDEKVPAYRVLTNKSLTLVAAARPTTEDALLDIHGIGPKTVEDYGAELLEILGGP